MLGSAGALSSWSSKTCKGGNYTTSLGNLFQCCTALIVKQFVLLTGQKLPNSSLWPLPLPHHLQLSRGIWLHLCNCPADNIRQLLGHPQPVPPRTKSNSFHCFSRGHALQLPEHLGSPSLEPLRFFDILLDQEAQSWTAILDTLPEQCHVPREKRVPSICWPHTSWWSPDCGSPYLQWERSLGPRSTWHPL